LAAVEAGAFSHLLYFLGQDARKGISNSLDGSWDKPSGLDSPNPMAFGKEKVFGVE